MKREIKLTGHNNIVSLSSDGNLIAVGGYDGSFKVYNMKKNSLEFKVKINGPRGRVIIWHQDISANQRYVAFSCFFKVYLIDFSQLKIIKEIEYSEEERMATIPFSFFKKSNKLVIPNGTTLKIYSIETEEYSYINLPENSGFTNCIAIDENDRYVAYKSNNSGLNEKIYIFDLENLTNHSVLDVPYKYISGSQMFENCIKFVSTNRIAVFRKDVGLSYFNVSTGKEEKTISFEDIGFRSVHSFHRSKISEDGRFVLIKKETPYKVDLDEWHVDIPDGLECVVYDLEEKKIVYRVKNGEAGGDINMQTRQVAYLNNEYDENNKRSEFLIVEKIDG